MRDEATAVLTIKGASDMTPEQRRNLAAWLREQAEHVQRRGSEYSKVFRARYIR